MERLSTHGAEDQLRRMIDTIPTPARSYRPEGAPKQSDQRESNPYDGRLYFLPRIQQLLKFRQPLPVKR